ncbi:MAG: transposase zinc-binding domain-containing protein, partial [Deltaproteobacteria bacterium]|nr:transposase zinc-binding domain-containing protein [Deltaproteobacteria bacterium]
MDKTADAFGPCTSAVPVAAPRILQLPWARVFILGPEDSAEDRLAGRTRRPRLQRELREANEGRGLPKFITKAVNAFLDCGVLSKGFCRLYCKSCKTDQLVAFSCKSRGICSSCDGKRMTELAAHLCDSVIG